MTAGGIFFPTNARFDSDDVHNSLTPVQLLFDHLKVANPMLPLVPLITWP